MANLLARETSPYLLQHADNPVHWHPWDQAALTRARAEDKPILLSIGYSTCHWCHVMARESFEDVEVAARMNASFINIKVDREERPDLDQIYQAAQQLLTGRPGGWPLTLFLMPDGTPFFGGTYFPPTPRHGLPGFCQVLDGVADAWRDRRDRIEQRNVALRAELSRLESPRPESRSPVESVEALTGRAIADIRHGFDPVHGGFSGAPKFPRATELEFLAVAGDAAVRGQVWFTLENMAARGLMDQIGGGFFRYSVDERWAIPHFEKMLYDNGLLLARHADAWAATERPPFARAVAATVAWLADEMTSPEGLFHAALDADSEHEEGGYYLWTPATAAACLSADEYRVAAASWGLDGPPNFENRAWHLGEARPLAEVAASLAVTPEAAAAMLESARVGLRAARAGRVRPGRDDKCLTAWNALVIHGLARAARRFGRADWLAMARRAADALRERVWREGRLAASFQGGEARHNGYLDDYAFLLDALLELAQAGWRDADLVWARRLADAMIDHFEDAEAGGFWFTSHDHERLIQRVKPAHDQAMPAGNGVAARALIRLGLVLGEDRYGDVAARALDHFRPLLAEHPAACSGLLLAARELARPPGLVVLGGADGEVARWHAALARVGPDWLVFAPVSGDAGMAAGLARPESSRVGARVCVDGVCRPEITDLDSLLALLSERGAA